MADTGINWLTGAALSGFDHVRQSLRILFSTRIGEIVMRRSLGSDVIGLLGRPLDPRTLLRFWTAIVIAVELWEPRFRVVQIIYPRGENTPERMRAGQLSFRAVGQYRPNALAGDLTPEPGLKWFSLG